MNYGPWDTISISGYFWVNCISSFGWSRWRFSVRMKICLGRAWAPETCSHQNHITFLPNPINIVPTFEREMWSHSVVRHLFLPVCQFFYCSLLTVRFRSLHASLSTHRTVESVHLNCMAANKTVLCDWAFSIYVKSESRFCFLLIYFMAVNFHGFRICIVRLLSQNGFHSANSKIPLQINEWSNFPGEKVCWLSGDKNQLMNELSPEYRAP